MFFLQLILSTVLLIIAVVIHALILDFTIRFLKKHGPDIFIRTRQMWRASMLLIGVLSVFGSHIIQIWIWAVFYYFFTEINIFEDALYFSTSTYTTVGFGDVVLDEKWRLISSFQSANGFILFGWSTAFIFELMTQLYRNEQIKRTDEKL
tara:strand:- start:3832 stop:4281 length:450 start_codon:yes stop_codon:yes gene_type:complete